jgi:hypothetical protein
MSDSGNLSAKIMFFFAKEVRICEDISFGVAREKHFYGSGSFDVFRSKIG